MSSDPNTWVEQYGDALYGYALMRLNNPAVAEDLVQDTFVAGLKARDRFAGESSEKTWLIGILKHKLIDHLRKTGRSRQVEDIEAEADRFDSNFDQRGHWATTINEWDDPNASLEQQEFWQTLSKCISALPDHMADLFILREVQGMPSEELLKMLEISTTNNLWVMMSRARMRLRECLEKNWFNEQPQAGI